MILLKCRNCNLEILKSSNLIGHIKRYGIDKPEFLNRIFYRLKQGEK